MSPFRQSLIWLSVSVLASMGMQLGFVALGLPSYLGLIMMIFLVIVFLYALTRRSFRSKFGLSNMYGSDRVKFKYKCLACNNRHSNERCPKCKSNRKKMEFSGN